MDEIFHGPQAREYCRGNFGHWHPKITTFPGLYYLGTMYGWARWAAQSLVGSLSLDAACSTPFLRSLNVVLSIACLWTLRAILRTHYGSGNGNHAAPAHGRPQRKDGSARPPSQARDPLGHSASLHALTLALYPLHWFFSFLFYTDVASLLFLLLCHLMAARRRYLLAALAGGFAVLCRQTNAVWAAFVLGEAALAELGLDRARSAAAPADAGTVADADADAAQDRAAGKEEERALARGGLLTELRVALSRAWRRRGRLAATLWPLLLPPAGFAAFLVANGGSVVLGDKAAHVPVRHGAQLLYFGAWSGAMLWPQLLPEVPRLARAAARRPLAAALVAAAAVAAAVGVVHVSTLSHPYLLADNRHYPFYLWRRLIARTPTSRYLLAPAYAAAWALLLSALLRRMSRLWVLGFALCLTAQLLPTWLLEFRYFTAGLFMIALRLEPPSLLQSIGALITYVDINLITTHFFLNRPFPVADGSTGRFLW